MCSASRTNAVSYTHLEVYKRQLRYYEGLALHYDVRGYCVCTRAGKDSRVLGHLMRRAGVRHFYMPSVTGIDPPELVYFPRANFQVYRDMGYLIYDVMYQYSICLLYTSRCV